VALAAGLIVLVWWLAALAGGAQSYDRMQVFAGAWPFKVLLALWLVAFVYHFANGVRHLFWDAGMGLERAQARRSATLVVVAVALVSLVLLLIFFGEAAA
jgi:succinate dehydrogenase / fumarate reductase cytochrome b subunit